MVDSESVFTNENLLKDISKVMDGETVIKIGLFENHQDNSIMYLGTPFIYKNNIFQYYSDETSFKRAYPRISPMLFVRSMHDLLHCSKSSDFN